MKLLLVKIKLRTNPRVGCLNNICFQQINALITVLKFFLLFNENGILHL